MKDASRSGRKPKITDEKEKAIVETTLLSKPLNATHWSVRLMAKAKNVSRMAVQRIMEEI